MKHIAHAHYATVSVEEKSRITICRLYNPQSIYNKISIVPSKLNYIKELSTFLSTIVTAGLDNLQSLTLI